MKRPAASRAVVIGGLLLSLAGAVACGRGGHDHGHDATVRHSFDDVEHWVKVFDDPERDTWQRPAEVVDFLGVRPGQAVADVGAGTGYFAVHLARAVGPSGKVYAVDVEPELIRHIAERVGNAGLPQVAPVLVEPDDPGLPKTGVDLVFICDTWHHIDDRLAWLDRARTGLRPGGRIAVVDFREGELPVGPPPGHKLTRDEVVAEFAEARFDLAAEHTDLPYQYLLVFTPRG